MNAIRDIAVGIGIYAVAIGVYCKIADSQWEHSENAFLVLMLVVPPIAMIIYAEAVYPDFSITENILSRGPGQFGMMVLAIVWLYCEWKDLEKDYYHRNH